jgi:WD40 repeat protein
MKSPFKFLDSYTKDDRDIFFGRDHEIEELYQRVFDSKLLLVYGVSGTGKSSLIHCGLANKFLDTDWLPIVIRRGGNIIESLSAGIRAASITAQQSKFVSPGDFKKGVRSLYLDHYKPIFLLFDQFEELFIFGDKEERKSFIHVVKTLTESNLQCRMIFVMREEYMAWVTEFERVIPTFFANRVRIEKMSHINALEAIKEPCKVFSISLEEGFGEALLEKLSPGSEDVEMTYLQVFLDKILRLAQSEKSDDSDNLSFNLNLLQKIGNVSDLLGKFLDEQINLLDKPEEGLAVLKSFVSVKGTKRQMSPEEISEYTQTFGKPIEKQRLLDLLQTFVNLRILRDKDQNGKYELRHDALATKIYEKITLVEKEILEIRQFIENAYANYEKRQLFLSSDDLKYIAPYQDKLYVNKTLDEFIENSKKNILAKKRAFHRTLRYSAIGFFVIIIAIVIYIIKDDKYKMSEELTFEASLQKDFSPFLSFQTALDAYNKDSSSISIKALFDSFYELLEGGPYYDSLKNELNPQKLVFDFTPCDSKILYARFSKNGKYIYGFLEDNSVNIWDITGKRIFSQSGNTNPIVAVNFAPDNEYIAAVYYDSTAIVWNIKGKIILKTTVVYDPLNPLDIINFSPDKHIITIINNYNKITVYNLEDSSQYYLEGHTGQVNGAVFSPNGNFIASASKDSSIIIWQQNDSTGHFEMANRINNINGVVWSVDFAKSSKYVLSVSDADQNAKKKLYYPVKIQNLIGKEVYTLPFHTDSTWNPEYPFQFRGKYYSARFILNDEAIRISTFSNKFPYSEKNDSQLNIKSTGYDYCNIIYSDINTFWIRKPNMYLEGYGTNFAGDPLDPKYAHYTYSFADESGKYIVINISGNNYSVLFTKDQLPIKKLTGIQPCFAPDGKYLLCLDGKYLKLYPADEHEIIRLTVKKAIFGKLDTNPTKWVHFFKDQYLKSPS